VQPHNIIWNKETGEIKITDFGISSIIVRSKDTTTVATKDLNSSLAHHMLGSLPYLPPELSLRSSDAATRLADHRSDFYSLGVTFFELLTGNVPFHERSAVRMMHAHMAKQAAAVHEVDGRVARCVSAVVGRLLAKSVEERYQSSRGLVADLLRCERIVAARQRPSLRRLRRRGHSQGTTAANNGGGSDNGKEKREGVEAEAEAEGAEGEEEEEEDEEWAEKADREFKAGEDDISDVFAFPAKLYGREDQIAQLKRIYAGTTKAAQTPSSLARNEVRFSSSSSSLSRSSLTPPHVYGGVGRVRHRW
jgi:serine/threonine protein kinase